MPAGHADACILYQITKADLLLLQPALQAPRVQPKLCCNGVDADVLQARLLGNQVANLQLQTGLQPLPGIGQVLLTLFAVVGSRTVEDRTEHRFGEHQAVVFLIEQHLTAKMVQILPERPDPAMGKGHP